MIVANKLTDLTMHDVFCQETLPKILDEFMTLLPKEVTEDWRQ